MTNPSGNTVQERMTPPYVEASSQKKRKLSFFEIRKAYEEVPEKIKLARTIACPRGCEFLGKRKCTVDNCVEMEKYLPNTLDKIFPDLSEEEVKVLEARRKQRETRKLSRKAQELYRGRRFKDETLWSLNKRVNYLIHIRGIRGGKLVCPRCGSDKFKFGKRRYICDSCKRKFESPKYISDGKGITLIKAEVLAPSKARAKNLVSDFLAVRLYSVGMSIVDIPYDKFDYRISSFKVREARGERWIE